MGTWLVSVGLVVALLGQTEPERPAAASKEAIQKAVRELGDVRFSVRRQASQFLWQQGLAAEPALKRAAEGADRETRLRARRILEDFRYGILPNVPQNVVGMIRQFRDGNVNERLLALQRLADFARFDALQRLIELEPAAEVRRQLLVYLMKNPRAVDHFLEPERLEKLIATIGADQEEAWRRNVLAQLLFSAPMVQKLAERDQLDVLMKVVEREKSADVRRQMLTMLFQNQAAVAALIEKDQLEFLLGLIAKEPDGKTRGTWITGLMVSSGAVKHLVEEDRLDRVLKFAGQHLDAKQRSTVLQRLFQIPSAVEAILAKRGIEGLVALTTTESDPAARGRMVAALVASSAVQQHVPEGTRYELTIKLARDEKDASARGEYLKAVLNSGAGYYLLRDQESRKSLWALVKEDTGKANSDWRGDAVYRILTNSSAHELLREAAEAEWLLRFLGEEPPPQKRAQIVERVIADSRLRKAVIVRGRFDAMLDLVKDLPADKRGRLMAQLFSIADPFQAFADAKYVELMVTLAEEEEDAEARCQYLQGLFQNQAVMAALVEGGYYDDLWKLVCHEKDPVRHATLRGEFIRTRAAVDAIGNKDQVEMLVKFAQDATNQEARLNYLRRLFASQPAMSMLVDKGHYDVLFALAQSDSDESSRAVLLGEFYTNTKVIERLIEKKQVTVVLEFAERHADEERLQIIWQRLFYNQQVVAALAQQGRAEAMLALAQRQEDKYFRATLIRSILAVPAVLSIYAERKRLEELFRLIQKETPETRQQVYYNIVNRSENVATLVEKGGLDGLLAGLKLESRPQTRGQMLARLIVHEKVMAHLVSKKRLKLILQLAREQKDEAAQREFFQSLFSSTTAIGALLERGHYDDLHELAASVDDPNRRAQYLARLLTNSSTIQHLVADKKIGRLLSLADETNDDQARRTVLTRILYSSGAIAALIENGGFDRLVEMCRSVSDPSARRRLLAELLRSDKAIQQLAAAESLKTTIQEVLQEPDQNARRQFLERWFTQSEAVDALLENGLLDTLYRSAEADPDPAQRRQLLGYLLTRETALRWLADEGKIDVLMGILIEETEDSRRRFFLQAIVQNAGTLDAVLAAGRFDKLLELINRQENTSSRHSLLVSFLLSPATIKCLAKNDQVGRLGEEIIRHDDTYLRGQFVQRLLYNDTGRRLLAEAKLGDELIAILRAEHDEKPRASAARSILGNTSLWGALVNSGQANVLREIVKWETDERLRRTYWCRILSAPIGLLPYHFERGEHEEAKRLLTENANDDLGRLGLATYLMATGQIDQQVAEIRERMEPAPNTDDARLLTYLLRAGGDLDGACEAARKTEDSGLLKAVLVEARQWSEAAELQAAGPCPLPIRTRYRLGQGDEQERHAEQLGLVAAYQRLAGREEDCENSVAEIRALAASPFADATLHWLCVESLLLNDRVDDGLKLLTETHPSRAFQLLTYRYQYREAFALARWPEDGSIDRKWLDSLPAEGGDADKQPVVRLEFAIRVARTLHMLGKREDALKVIALLEDYADDQPDGRSTSAPRRQCWEHLSVALAELGYHDRAWTAGARTLLSPTSRPPMLSRLYPNRYEEARGWWIFFRKRYESEPSTETFSRVHRVMNAPQGEDPEEFTALAEEAMELGESLSDSYPGYVATAVAESCRRRGRLELARRCLEIADESDSALAWAVADMLRDDERWGEAAEAYEAAWENDRGELAALYLSGEALERAGQTDEGRRRKDQANLMALDSRARLDMALSLMRHGLQDEGIEQLRLVLRTAPFENWEWHEAVRRLGDHTLDKDPAEAADLFELSLLDDLRTYFHLLDHKDYLHTPSVIHRLRARSAIDAGEFEAAEREIKLALAASPGATRVAEDLVPLLEQVGQKARADKLFEDLHSAYSEWTATHPDCGSLHNNIAWMSARCGRRLDEALQHAEQAIELAPSNASYLDTVAECHFRLGDREAAIRYSRRAVESRPESESLKRQLDRFQNAPLPKRSE